MKKQFKRKAKKKIPNPKEDYKKHETMHLLGRINAPLLLLNQYIANKRTKEFTEQITKIKVTRHSSNKIQKFQCEKEIELAIRNRTFYNDKLTLETK